MAQMEWNKYPEVMPPAEDSYLVVDEFVVCHKDGTDVKQRSVFVSRFTYDLSTADPIRTDDKAYTGPGFFNVDPIDGFYKEENIIYWMPLPKAPED